MVRMRSSVLPRVEPDGPVINSFAACLKLEVLKIVWVFPDRCAFADGMTALIVDGAERLRAGWINGSWYAGSVQIWKNVALATTTRA